MNVYKDANKDKWMDRWTPIIITTYYPSVLLQKGTITRICKNTIAS